MKRMKSYYAGLFASPSQTQIDGIKRNEEKYLEYHAWLELHPNCSKNEYEAAYREIMAS